MRQCSRHRRSRRSTTVDHVDRDRTDPTGPTATVGHRAPRGAGTQSIWRSRDRSRHQRDHRRARRVGTRALEETRSTRRSRPPTTSCCRATRRSAPTRPRCNPRRRRSRRPAGVAGAHRHVVEPERRSTVTAGTGIVERQPHVHRRRARDARAASARRTSSPAPRPPSPPDTSMLVAAGGQALGFSTFESDDALAARGAHDHGHAGVEPARRRSATPRWRASTAIDGTNDTLQLSINGTPTTLTLAHGTYTAAQLAAAVQAAATAAGAPITATLDTARARSSSHDHRGGQRRDPPGHRRRRARRAEAVDRRRRAHAGSDGMVQVDGGADPDLHQPRRGPERHAERGRRARSPRRSRGGLHDRDRSPATNVSTGDGSLGDRRRQHQLRRRGSDRHRGAGRAQHVPPAAHVEHDRRDPRREHRRARRSTPVSAGFLDGDRGRRRAGHRRRRRRRVPRVTSSIERRSPACCRASRHTVGTMSTGPVTVVDRARRPDGLADQGAGARRRRQPGAQTIASD